MSNEEKARRDRIDRFVCAAMVVEGFATGFDSDNFERNVIRIARKGLRAADAIAEKGGEG